MNPDIRFYQQAAQAQMNVAHSQYLAQAQAAIGTGGTANYNPYVWYDSSAGSGGVQASCVGPPAVVPLPKNEKDWLRGRVDEILWRG